MDQAEEVEHLLQVNLIRHLHPHQLYLLQVQVVTLLPFLPLKEITEVQVFTEEQYLLVVAVVVVPAQLVVKLEIVQYQVLLVELLIV